MIMVFHPSASKFDVVEAGGIASGPNVGFGLQLRVDYVPASAVVELDARLVRQLPRDLNPDRSNHMIHRQGFSIRQTETDPVISRVSGRLNFTAGDDVDVAVLNFTSG